MFREDLCPGWISTPVSAAPRQRFVEGLVECCALTYRVKSAPDRKGLFIVYLEDGMWFAAKQPPRLYDANRQTLPLQDVPAGSLVKLCLDGGDWITAIQVLQQADDCPF